MEIVSIERKTFEELVAKFDRFASRMDAICHRHGEKKMNEWMDNQDVCRILNISTRTLQTLRDNGTLGYSQINHKIYYHPEDVQRIMSAVEGKRKKKSAMAVSSDSHTE
ncbi:helix-turn-helix domain-containing protein [Parabacteroides distasonis]|uniref:Helix-turn-helix domain-containing protein n=1 Tax=Parabacteroides distasonis TaxID=823 RepID=A0A7L5EDR5_PARDI|nr:helix-turn-helix domain-containing protein [Parabacteroides distasonis]QJE28944.1 helix-turn-helix domain-containing protein [Parabacteroides distasonis]WRY41575.1 helix-turn-helix domain-containing protein [Parabacteroides distasonis]